MVSQFLNIFPTQLTSFGTVAMLQEFRVIFRCAKALEAPHIASAREICINPIALISPWICVHAFGHFLKFLGFRAWFCFVRFLLPCFHPIGMDQTLLLFTAFVTVATCLNGVKRSLKNSCFDHLCALNGHQCRKCGRFAKKFRPGTILAPIHAFGY